MQIQLYKILDVGICYDILRSIRWELGVKCTDCQSKIVVKNGKDSTNIHVQRYHCHNCKSYFDDLSDTVFSGSHQPLHHGAARAVDNSFVFNESECFYTSNNPRVRNIRRYSSSYV